MENKKPTPQDLEPQQYQRLYWEEDIPLRDIRRGMLRPLILFGLILSIAILFISAFVKYPDQVELPFVLKSPIAEEVYTFPFPVYVEEVFVTPGKIVQQQQPLLRITAPEIVALIRERDQFQAEKSSFIQYREASFSHQQNILAHQLQQQQLDRNRIEEELKQQEQKWTTNRQTLEFSQKNALQQWQTGKSLLEQGGIAPLDVQILEEKARLATDALRTAEVTFRQNKLRLQTQMAAIDQAISASRQEEAKLQLDLQSESIAIQNNISLSGDYIQRLFGNYRIEGGSIVLLSTSRGKVTFLFEGEKEVAASRTLLKLGQVSQEVYAFIKCPPSIMGKVEVGMSAHLKVSSFPFYEWGTAMSRLKDASSSPDEEGFYNLRMDISDYGKLHGHLFPGLTGKAVIILEEKTLLQYFFSHLSKQYHYWIRGDLAEN